MTPEQTVDDQGTVESRVDGSCLRITLHRARRHNALSLKLINELLDVLRHDGLHRVRVAELEGIVRHRRDVAVAPVHRAPARAGPLASSGSTAVNFAACVQAFRRAP